MDRAEQVTKVVLEAIFPGSNLKFHENQSKGEYDFDLHYPNGLISAVETTSSIDQVLTYTNAQIRDECRGGQTVPATLCKKSWIVFPTSGAPVKRIRKKIDQRLANLEIEGFEHFDCLDQIPLVRDLCVELQLVRGAVISSAPGPQTIDVAYAGGVDAVGSTTATKAAEKEAWKQDNRKKLDVAKTNERHLFVYVNGIDALRMNSGPWVALVHFEPPSESPNLPKEITHIWLATEDLRAGHFIVWQGTANQKWRNLRQPMLGRST
jgi:hypothetical protein